MYVAQTDIASESVVRQRRLRHIGTGKDSEETDQQEN